MKRWPFVVVVLAVLAGVVLSTVAARSARSQSARDPAIFFLPDEELPAGFVYQPDRDQLLTERGATSLLRWYLRANPEVGPDDVTLLQIAVQTFDSAEGGRAVYDATISAWERDGYSFEPLIGGAGERGVLGRKLSDEHAERPSEGVLLYEQLGTINLGVQWGDYADLPNADLAFGVLRQLEQRAAGILGQRSSPQRSPTATPAPTSQPVATPPPAPPPPPPAAAPPPPPPPPPPGPCCRVCTSGKACGDTCIAANRTCNTSRGCACNGYAPGGGPGAIGTFAGWMDLLVSDATDLTYTGIRSFLPAQPCPDGDPLARSPEAATE